MAGTRTRGAAALAGLTLLAATGCTSPGSSADTTDSGRASNASSPAAPTASADSSTPSAGAAGSAPGSATPSAEGTEDGPPPARGSVRVDRTVIGGQNVPWGLDRLPGGDVIHTGRDQHRVYRLDPQNGSQRLLGTVQDAVSTSEGGLLGVAVPPDFNRTRQLYFYYTTDSDNRIVRMDYDGSRPANEQLRNPEVILDQIPSGAIHNGGRIAFGPDGMLYAGTGEAGDTALSQDPDSLGGKILRMTPTGDPAPDNPNPDSLVYSLGHRNVQGLTWDAAGRLWAAEFGQDTFDELNLIEAGDNYGWPEVEGRTDGNEYTDPVAQWSTDENSPSGIAFAAGSIWMAGLGGERLWRIPLDGTEPVAEPRAFLVGDYGRLRSVIAADDDTLLLTTSNTDGRGSPADQDDRILELTVT